METVDEAAARLVLWLAINNGGSREARGRFVSESLCVLDQLEVVLAGQRGAAEKADDSDRDWFLGDLPGSADSSMLGAVRIFRSLVAGILTLCEAGNTYAAAALVRQVVEVEYLCWAFAEDQAEADDWRSSSREDRLRRWQPRHLRERSGGRFRAIDYQEHCELGGHPTPAGFELFRPRAIGLVYWETAVHVKSALNYLLQALGAADNPLLPAGELAARVWAAAGSWQEQDMMTGLANSGVLATLSSRSRHG